MHVELKSKTECFTDNDIVTFLGEVSGLMARVRYLIDWRISIQVLY